MIPGGGDKVVVLPLKGGGKVVVPISTPSIGDKCVTIPLQGGGKVPVKLRKLYKGETVAIVHVDGGVKVPIPLTDIPKIEFIIRINFGSGGEFVRTTYIWNQPWNKFTAFYGIPFDYYPFYFQYVEISARIGKNIAVCRSIGAEKNFGSPLRVEQVFSLYTKFIDGACYIDAIQFWDYSRNITYDLNGNGGFETGEGYWSLTGDAIITDTEYYEGSHCLKLL